MCRRSLHGNREVSCPANDAERCWSAAGRRGADAADARAREVRPGHSSSEADEQRQTTGSGVGGAKGRGRGEREPAKHAPGAGPGKRVPGAGARTTSRKAKKEGEVRSPRSSTISVFRCFGLHSLLSSETRRP